MYGTDLGAGESENPHEVNKHAHELWIRDWRYLATGDTLESPFVNKKFKGLMLPRTVIDKIYFKNTEKWYFNKGN